MEFREVASIINGGFLKDPVYEKLENLNPYEYCRDDTPLGKYCADQAEEGRKVLMRNMNFITKNFDDPNKYQKYLEAKGVELVVLILNPDFIRWFDYGEAFKESAYIREAS